jgi:two-component system response regulator RegA
MKTVRKGRSLTPKAVVSDDSTPHVLVVDDNRAFVDFVGRVLLNAGMAAAVATTFDEAAAMIAERAPARVISELKVSGQYLVEHIHRLVARIAVNRIVVATVYPSVATAVQLVKMGVTVYLTKPLSGPTIVEACRADGASARSTESRETLPWPTLDRTIWEYLSHVLTDAGSVSEAARRLGLDRRSLRRMLAKYPPVN